MKMNETFMLSEVHRASAMHAIEGSRWCPCRKSRSVRSTSILLRDRRATTAPFAFFLLLLALTACNPATPQPSITTITIGPETIHTHVKRFGINLSGQSFYDSGQMLRNLIFRNPGFEGQTWQSILHCKSATRTTCTDENQYAVWPVNFLAGAQYELLSGPNRGFSGTVQFSSAAAGDHGVNLTLASPGKPASAGDFLLVRIDKPGTAEAGWWSSLQN
jgi:hypothetical protein